MNVEQAKQEMMDAIENYVEASFQYNYVKPSPAANRRAEDAVRDAMKAVKEAIDTLEESARSDDD